ncbi:MAG: hypothetical protein ACREDH_12030 [Methylocella sp.]
MAGKATPGLGSETGPKSTMGFCVTRARGFAVDFHPDLRRMAGAGGLVEPRGGISAAGSGASRRFAHGSCRETDFCLRRRRSATLIYVAWQ